MRFGSSRRSGDNPYREPGPTFGTLVKDLYREDAKGAHVIYALNVVSIRPERLRQRRRGEPLTFVNQEK